jgi:signal transduction histidine kinase
VNGLGRIGSWFGARELARRPLPSAAVAVGVALLLWLMPAPDRDYGLLAVAAVLGLGLVGMAAAWRRFPTLVRLALPLGYLLFAVVLRASAGASFSGFAGLLLLPVIWLALSARRAELIVGLLGMAAALFVPLLVIGPPDYPGSGWRGAVVLLSVAAVAGFTIQALVEETHRANVELDRKNQLQADFVALAAHELRTPATSIYGFAVTLDRHAQRLRPEQVAELQHVLATEGLRLTQLVEQLLDLSRLDAEGIEINPSRMKVREKVEALLPLAAGERLGDIRLEIPAELEATVDPVAFERIISNLVTNAVRYGSPPITVEAEQKDRHFRISVVDRGNVPEQFVPNLFERFRRSPEAGEQSAGTGLGLAIARSYARAHRGDLIYERGIPSGSRFQLVLPNG